MPYKRDMLSLADKDRICEFVYRSVGKVLNTNITPWEGNVPQGVSVYRAHPSKGTFEYMFTKDEKYPVVRDEYAEVMEALYAYGNLEAGGLVYYLNSCMLKVASKHKQFGY